MGLLILPDKVTAQPREVPSLAQGFRPDLVYLPPFSWNLGGAERVTYSTGPTFLTNRGMVGVSLGTQYATVSTKSSNQGSSFTCLYVFSQNTAAMCTLSESNFDRNGSNSLRSQQIRVDASGNIALNADDSAQACITSGSPITVGKVHAAVVSWNNATSKGVICVDGVNYAGAGSGVTFDPGGSFVLGRKTSGNSNESAAQTQFLFARWSRPLSLEACAKLSRNPWSIFAPGKMGVWTPSFATSGGDASASLTGSAGTSSTGAVIPSISASISGVSATSAVGALSPSTGATASLSGTASTASVGSLSPEVSRAVAGSQLSTSVGTTTAGLSKALTGSAATTSSGTLSPSVGATATLSGVASTTSTGALAATLSITLGGISATASVGTLALPGSYSAALTASQVTTSAGAATPSVSKSIVGAQSTTSVGSLSAVTGATAALSGVQTTCAAGALSKSVTLAIAGCQSTTFAGALGKISSLSGHDATTSVGTMNASTEPFIVTEVLAARTLFVKPKRSTDIAVREKQKSVTVMWS